MHYKITIFGACAPYPYHIELHRLPRKGKKMTYHQNPGPGDNYHNEERKTWDGKQLNE